MPAWQPAEIGPLYDLGIATRDGSSLSCLNKDGKPVPISKLAFMLAPDKQNPFKESTELQEKDRLIQLGTSTSIDREFEQWPQNTQGDWSGGIGQRVYGLDGITNQSFRGQGLIWPSDDWLPQQPIPGFKLSPGLTPTPTITFTGTVGGFVANFGDGYAYAYNDGTGLHIVFRSGSTVNDFKFSTSTTIDLFDMVIAAGSIWIVTWDSIVTPANIVLSQISAAAVANTLAQVGASVNIVTDGANPTTASAVRARVAVDALGTKLYVATAITYFRAAGAGWANRVDIFDYTGGTSGGATTLTFPTTPTAFLVPELALIDIDFQSGIIYISLSDGYTVSIMQSTAPFSSVSTTALLPGMSMANICSLGSTLFIIAWAGTSIAQGQAGTIFNVLRAELYTLTGGTLTQFGSLKPQNLARLQSLSKPSIFGSYALWTAIYQNFGDPNWTIAVFAFDLVRSRLFEAFSIGGTVSFGGILPPPLRLDLQHLAVFKADTIGVTGLTGASAGAQWGVAVSTEFASNHTELLREFYFGVQPQTPNAFTALWQGATDILSGLFDFTAASPKLFRQILVTFLDGLAVANPFITVNAWLDQDPGLLNPTPDYTTTLSGAGLVPPLPTSLALPINKIARKLVYEVITGGGGLLPNSTQAPGVTDIGDGTGAAQANVILHTTAPAAVGDLVVVCATGISLNFDTTSSVIDQRGNVYTLAFVDAQAAVGGILIAYSVLTTALLVNDTVTVRWRLASAQQSQAHTAATIIQVTGLPNAVVDVSAHAHANSSAPAVTTGATSYNREVLIGMIARTTATLNVPPIAPWTAVGGTGDANVVESPFAQINDPSASYSLAATLSAAQQWQAGIVAFRSGSFVWQSNPKIVDVAVQAATGWVVDGTLDLGPSVLTNSKASQDYCFQKQSVPGQTSIDHVAAYNFLRQLWRLKGGQIALTLPNQDAYLGLIQQMEFDSPKPFAASFRSDQQASLQQVCAIKIREDI